MSKESMTKANEENRNVQEEFILAEAAMEIIRNNDLIDCGRGITRFAQAALIEADRKGWVDHLYWHFSYWSIARDALEDQEKKEQKKYRILEKERANCAYLANAVPLQSSPAKTLHALEEFGERIVSQFSEPTIQPLSPMAVEEIMNALDETYNFSNAVFNGQRAVIAIINKTHAYHNSECLMRRSEFTNFPYIFLFSSATDECTPEAILYHELGHILQIQYSIATGVTPAGMIADIDAVLGIESNLQSDEMRQEVLADLLSVGLMYGGPFSAHIPFKGMDKGMGEILNEFARYALEYVSEMEREEMAL